MIELIITEFDRAWAREQALMLGNLPKSMTHGERNEHGLLGEIIVCNYMDGKIEHTNHYDIVKNGYTIDVKTKCCAFKPRLDYEVDVIARINEQQCDYYAFVRMLTDKSKAWFLGGISKKAFYDRAIFRAKDEPNPDRPDGWKQHINSYCLKISKLEPYKNARNKI